MDSALATSVGLLVLSAGLAGCPSGGAGAGGSDTATSSGAGHCGKSVKVLVSGVDAPAALVVDDNNVYWQTGNLSADATSPLAMKVPIEGGAAVTLVERAAPANTLYGNLSVAGGNVYVPTDQLLRVPVGGGAPSVAYPGYADTTAVGPTGVYFSRSTDKTILKVPFDGSSASVIASGVTPKRQLVASSEYLFWSQSRIEQNPVDPIETTELHRMRLDGGEDTVLVDAVPGIGAIAATDSFVYWLGGGGIQRTPVAGPPGVVIMPGATAFSIAADASGLYGIDGFYEPGDTSPDGELLTWTFTWTVTKYPTSGPLIQLATGSTSVSSKTTGVPGIALDAHCVYWSDAGVSGQIESIAK